MSRAEIQPATLEHELLEFLARNARRMPVPVFLVTGLIAGIAYETVRNPWPIVWLAGVAGMLVLRYVWLGRLPLQDHLSEERRVRIAIALSGANGVLHGLSLLFFPMLGEVDRLLVTMMVLALCAGAVGSTVGYRPVFFAYVLPLLAPLSILWAINPGAEVDWRHLFLAGLALLFIGLLGALARDAFRLFRESFEIRLEHLELNRRLERALSESRSANDAKTRFLAAASHDLRQPVHALGLFSAALARRSLDERTREISTHIAEALDALSLELDALLDISKLDAGVVKPNVVSVDLGPMLSRLERQFAPLAEEKGLELTVGGVTPAIVRSDEMLLEQIVRNLLSNAVKYTDEGRVSLTVDRAEVGFRLEIADTGGGIPEQARDTIFEEFYQLDNPSRDRARGLGLGLAIIKRLVGLLSIPLEMDSVEGEGTTFRLTLPDGTPQESRTDPAIAPVRLEDLHVLVVDDESEVLEGMRALLEQLGCEVTLAGTTAGALEAVGAARPDVVLCDYRLANGDDGLRTVDGIRRIHPGVPAVLITGDTAADRVRDAHDSELIVLYKPIGVDALTAAIQRALATPTGAGGGG